MKKILFLFFACTFLQSHAQQSNVYLLSGPGDNVFFDIEIGNDGAMYVSGASTGGIPLTNGDTLGNEGFVAKYDSAGNLQWIMAAGEHNGLIAYSVWHAPIIALDNAGNLYVAGSFADSARLGNVLFTDTGYYNVFLARIDPNGNILWSKTCTDEAWVNSITVDHSNHPIISGHIRGVTDFEGTVLTPYGISQLPDVFLARYDENGSLIWVQQAGSSGTFSDYAMDVIVDINDNIIITGGYRSDAMFGSHTLTYHFQNFCCWESFVAKYDSSGNALWVRPLGSDIKSVAADADGNIYAAGPCSYTWDGSSMVFFNHLSYMIGKFDPLGNLEWYIRDTLLVGSYSSIIDLAIDVNGNFFGAGFFRDITVLGSDLNYSSSCSDSTPNVAWFFGMDSLKMVLFSDNFQTCGVRFPNSSYGYSVAINGCRMAYCGQLADSVDYYFQGDTIYQAVGNSSAFIVRYDTCSVSTEVQKTFSESIAEIYPNPFTEKLKIHFSNESKTSLNKITVMNGFGMVLKKIIANSLEQEIDLSGVPAGIYHVSIETNNRNEVFKIIKY